MEESRRGRPANWNGDLLEKLTGDHIVEKFPEFCRTEMFITVFIKLRLWSPDEPSESSPLLIILSHNIHINFILPSTPQSSK